MREVRDDVSFCRAELGLPEALGREDLGRVLREETLPVVRANVDGDVFPWADGGGLSTLEAPLVLRIVEVLE